MMALTAETRRRLREMDSRWPIKFWLRVVASFFSLIGIILLAAAVSLWDKNFRYINSVNSGDWSDGFPIAPVSCSSSRCLQFVDIHAHCRSRIIIYLTSVT